MDEGCKCGVVVMELVPVSFFAVHGLLRPAPEPYCLLFVYQQFELDTGTIIVRT
jgi:hypothetical protein